MHSATLNGHHERAALRENRPLNDDHLLKKLEQLWQSRNEHDLDIRRQMGELLNKRYGPPTEKGQTYGKKVLERAAKRLGLTKGDLSRLRGFALHYETLMKRHKVKTWSEVKKVLPTLTSEGKQRKAKASSTKKNKACRSVRKAESSLKAATAIFDRMGKGLSDDDRERLLKTLRTFAKALKRRLRVRFTFEDR